MGGLNSNLSGGRVHSFSQQSQASAAAQSSMSVSPAQSGWSSAMDDVALGCESADPALQIAMWGQEAAESVQAAATSV
jgi:hypothetical protein